MLTADKDQFMVRFFTIRISNMKIAIAGTNHEDLPKRLTCVNLSPRVRPEIHGLRIRSGMYASNGNLFNHESPRRGETFVTCKITWRLASIQQSLEECLYIANIDALRDWGHAKDYVRKQWMMLQQTVAKDFVIVSGKQYSIRQFIEWTGTELGMQLRWKGPVINEMGYWLNPPLPSPPLSGECRDGGLASKVSVARIDLRYVRPTEVETLLGDPTKTRK